MQVVLYSCDKRQICSNFRLIGVPEKSEYLDREG